GAGAELQGGGGAAEGASGAVSSRQSVWRGREPTAGNEDYPQSARWVACPTSRLMTADSYYSRATHDGAVCRPGREGSGSYPIRLCIFRYECAGTLGLEYGEKTQIRPGALHR